MFPFLKKHLNPQVRNQQNSKQYCLPPLSFKISLKDTFFHISLKFLGFYFSLECLLKLIYSTMCGKNFQICGVHISRKCIKCIPLKCIFIHAAVPHSKLQAEIFENLFPPSKKAGGGENYDLRYQNSIKKYEKDL